MPKTISTRSKAAKAAKALAAVGATKAATTPPPLPVAPQEAPEAPTTSKYDYPDNAPPAAVAVSSTGSVAIASTKIAGYTVPVRGYTPNSHLKPDGTKYRCALKGWAANNGGYVGAAAWHHTAILYSNAATQPLDGQVLVKLVGALQQKYNPTHIARLCAIGAIAKCDSPDSDGHAYQITPAFGAHIAALCPGATYMAPVAPVVAPVAPVAPVPPVATTPPPPLPSK